MKRGLHFAQAENSSWASKGPCAFGKLSWLLVDWENLSIWTARRSVSLLSVHFGKFNSKNVILPSPHPSVAYNIRASARKSWQLHSMSARTTVCTRWTECKTCVSCRRKNSQNFMGSLINLSQEHRHGKTGALNHPSHKFAPHLIGGRFVDVVAITFKARLNITVEDRWPLPSLQASPIFVESQMKPWVMSNEYKPCHVPSHQGLRMSVSANFSSKTGASSTIRLTFWRSWKGSGPSTENRWNKNPVYAAEGTVMDPFLLLRNRLWIDCVVDVSDALNTFLRMSQWWATGKWRLKSVLQCYYGNIF